MEGFVGNFKSTLSSRAGDQPVEHGIAEWREPCLCRINQQTEYDDQTTREKTSDEAEAAGLERGPQLVRLLERQVGHDEPADARLECAIGETLITERE